MRIGLDIDGVLANFYVAYERLCIEVSGVDKFGENRWPHVYPCTWNWPEHYGYSSGTVKEVWRRIKADPHFWVNLGTLPDFQAFVRYYNDRRHEWYFITARPGVMPKGQTEDWFAANGFDKLTILISNLKGLCCRALDLELYVDDKGENILDVQQESPSTRAVLLNRPYNAEFRGINRASSLEEVLGG